MKKEQVSAFIWLTILNDFKEGEVQMSTFTFNRLTLQLHESENKYFLNICLEP